MAASSHAGAPAPVPASEHHAQALSEFAFMVETRRHLHAHPELSYKEFETAKLVASTLRATPGVMDVREQVGVTGVTALIHGGAGDGPCIALRADMDALPIQEANAGLPYASVQPGVMHACGHDAHVAVLLATAKLLAARRASLRGCVKLIFQPAEEGGAGAVAMIDAGVLEAPHVDEIYGLHMWNSQRAGEVSAQAGAVMANSDRFSMVVRGRGGHGAMPHQTRDPTIAAATLVTALQTIASRSVDPLEACVVTVGTLAGGYGANIIADSVTLRGTCRTYSLSVQALVRERMQAIADGVALMFGVNVDFVYDAGYPATVNTLAATEHVRAAVVEALGAPALCDLSRSMAGEDFAFFLLQRPGCFFFVGSAPAHAPLGAVPHHIATFDIDEAAMHYGAAVFLSLVARRLVAAPTSASAAHTPADALAAPSQASVREAVLLLAAVREGWLRGSTPSLATLEQSLADDFTLVRPCGAVLPRAALLAGLAAQRGSAPAAVVRVASVCLLAVSGALAVVAFDETTELPPAAPTLRRLTAVLRVAPAGLCWLRLHESLVAG